MYNIKYFIRSSERPCLIFNWSGICVYYTVPCKNFMSYTHGKKNMNLTIIYDYHGDTALYSRDNHNNNCIHFIMFLKYS